MNEILQLTTEHLYLSLSPLYTKFDIVYDLVHVQQGASNKAILTGNSGIQQATMPIKGKKHLDPIQNILPFFHLARNWLILI